MAGDYFNVQCSSRLWKESEGLLKDLIRMKHWVYGCLKSQDQLHIGHCMRQYDVTTTVSLPLLSWKTEGTRLAQRTHKDDPPPAPLRIYTAPQAGNNFLHWRGLELMLFRIYFILTYMEG